jgi:hypothetical protein
MKSKFAILGAILAFAFSAAFAQNAAPSTFALTLSPISLPGNHQTVAGSEAGAMLSITKNFDIGNVDVIAPGQNFQYYAGRVNYRLPWLSTKLNNLSPNLNGARFQFGLTASAGMDRITTGAGSQHYAMTGGGFINYDLTGSGRYSMGVEIQYAKFPGMNNNTVTVSMDPAIHF